MGHHDEYRPERPSIGVQLAEGAGIAAVAGLAAEGLAGAFQRPPIGTPYYGAENTQYAPGYPPPNNYLPQCQIDRNIPMQADQVAAGLVNTGDPRNAENFVFQAGEEGKQIGCGPQYFHEALRALKQDVLRYSGGHETVQADHGHIRLRPTQFNNPAPLYQPPNYNQGYYPPQGYNNNTPTIVINPFGLLHRRY